MTEHQPEPPTSIVELTVNAMDERRARWDWDYVMCTYIRAWEDYVRQSYRRHGKLPLGSLAWYHWHDICDRAFLRLETSHRDLLRRAVELAGDTASEKEAEVLLEAGRSIIRTVLMDECEVAWMTMNERLERRGIPLYVDVSAEDPCDRTTEQ